MGSKADTTKEGVLEYIVVCKTRENKRKDFIYTPLEIEKFKGKHQEPNLSVRDCIKKLIRDYNDNVGPNTKVSIKSILVKERKITITPLKCKNNDTSKSNSR